MGVTLPQDDDIVSKILKSQEKTNLINTNIAIIIDLSSKELSYLSYFLIVIILDKNHKLKTRMNKMNSVIIITSINIIYLL